VSPVNRPSTPKKITVPMFESVFLPAWLMTVAATETPPPAAPVSGVARGEYLVRAVGHCGECHTPRSALTMAVDNSRSPAIRRRPGLRAGDAQYSDRRQPGDWTEEQIVRTSARNWPDGDVAGGPVARTIQGYRGLARIHAADLEAIARYSRAFRRSRIRSSSGRAHHT
jgi:mono/diheme cytochrome c family protein